MELISLKCPYPNCHDVVVLELLNEGEHARFKKAGSKTPGAEDTVLVACPHNHTFNVSFRSIHRTSFQP